MPDFDEDVAVGQTGHAATHRAIATRLNQLSEDALNATIAGVVEAAGIFTGVRVLFIGDSVTNGSSASNASLAFPSMSMLIAGSARLKYTVAGYPGERSDEILAELPALLTSTVDHVHVQVGTNDASQSRTLAQFQTSIIGFVAAAKAAGKTISFGLVYPRGAAATTADGFLRLYNAWLAQYARREGILLADAFGALADVTTGYLHADYDSGDGTHPNNAGHLQLAKAIAPVIIAKQAPYVARDFMVSPLGLLSNPLMNGTTGWADQGGTGTASVTTVPAEPGDGLQFGSWLQMRIDNTAGGGSVNRQRGHTIDAAKYSAGDVLAVVGRVGHNGKAGVKLQITNGGTAFTVSADVPTTVPAPGPILRTFTVPASPGTLRAGFIITVGAGLDGYAWLGECQVINLTTGGLVNDF